MRRRRTSIRATTTLEALAKLKPIVKEDGTVTAGNASGVNDGACALIVASEAAAKQPWPHAARAHRRHGRGAAWRRASWAWARRPRRRSSSARLGIPVAKMDVIELNEAFAAQALAVLRELGVADDAPHVNPNGGAIALGHPLGASGARLVDDRRCTSSIAPAGATPSARMCIGVGQGIALLLERA